METLLFGGPAMFEELLAKKDKTKTPAPKTSITASDPKLPSSEEITRTSGHNANHSVTGGDNTSPRAPKKQKKTKTKTKRHRTNCKKAVVVNPSPDTFSPWSKSGGSGASSSSNKSFSSNSSRSDVTPVEAAPSDDEPFSHSTTNPVTIQVESHPRVVGAAYWKEFSSRPNGSHDQARILEAAVQQKQKRNHGSGGSWGMPFFH